MLPTSSEREDAAVKNAATPFVNHAAYAQNFCAASSCPAMPAILVILLDADLLLGSIFVLLGIPGHRMTARHFPSPQAASLA